MPDEFKDKISSEDKESINKAVKEAEDKMKSDDKDELETAAKDLSEVLQGIGAKMYQESSKDEDANKDDKKSDSDEAVEGEVVDKK